MFVALFLLLFPFFLLFLYQEKWHFYAYKLNYIWAKVFYALCFFQVEVVWHPLIDKKKTYIFCPNHTSFFDITIMGFTPVYFVFVGKSSIAKVPLFGYMYKKMHITVDRDKLKSKYETFLKSAKAIDQGKSLVIFPEGGIYSKHPPEMGRFKDGPFRVAIEKQIPVIPVTIPYNWIILPDDGRFMVHWRKAKVIYHQPISTVGMDLRDLDRLKEKVYDIINQEIREHNETRILGLQDFRIEGVV